MSNDELLESTTEAVRAEKAAITNVTRHFQEIFERTLYLPKYSSMFEMLREEYGYCAGSAQIRINAIRLIRDVPCVREKLESGEMSMSVASNIQSFLYSEKKSARPYSENAKVELIETCIGKSVLEVQKEFVRRNPEIEKREIVRPTSDSRLRVSHSVSTKLEEKLQRIKMLWSHVDPDMSREMLLDRMADLVLAKIDPSAKAAKVKTKQEATDDSDLKSFHVHEIEKRSRYVSAEVKRAVYEKNQDSGCEFVEPSSERRCGSQFQLQLDHIQPFSAGGPQTPENLRVLCARHNRWRYVARC